MTLNQLDLNENAIIKNISAEETLKARFNSFGIIKTAIIKVLAITLAKETIEIQVNRTRIAIRLSEALKIEVEKC